MAEARHLVQAAIGLFGMNGLRLCVWLALLMAIFVPLERLAPRHRRPVFRGRFGQDVGYYFLNGLLPKFLLAVPIAALAWALHGLVPAGLQAWSGALPLWARFIAALAVGEVGFYWGHRLMHEIPLLWRFHAVHHSAEAMDFLVNTRAHPVDLVFTRMCGFVPLYLTGLVAPAGNTTDIVPLLILVVGTGWGFLVHANLRWRLGWLSWLVSTPAFHHWHHTRTDHRDRNYAAMLPVFDRIFGTFYMPRRQWPAEYGTDTVVADGLFGQLLQPLGLKAERPLRSIQPSAARTPIR